LYNYGMNMTVENIITEIRQLCALPESTKPYMNKYELELVLDLLGLDLPGEVGFRKEAYYLFKEYGWQLSGTLLTKTNAKILLGLVKEAIEKITEDKKFVEKETIEANFPTTPIQERVEEEKDSVQQLLKEQLMDQYLKSAIRNLDLIEEIHFIKGKEIIIITKR